MHKKRNSIIGVIILLGLVIGSVGYYLYTKPRQSAANETAVVSLAAAALYQQYQKDEPGADKKYLGKVVEVRGNLSAISHNNGVDVFSLSADNAAGGINCQMFVSDKNSAVKVGDAITVKGKCTGFLMDVNLVDCIIK